MEDGSIWLQVSTQVEEVSATASRTRVRHSNENELSACAHQHDCSMYAGLVLLPLCGSQATVAE